MKLIYLEWEDALASSSWHTKDELEGFCEETATIKQIGWLYKENTEFIVLVGRLDDRNKDDRGYGNLQKIPKTWIRKRKVLTKYIK